MQDIYDLENTGPDQGQAQTSGGFYRLIGYSINYIPINKMKATKIYTLNSSAWFDSRLNKT